MRRDRPPRGIQDPALCRRLRHADDQRAWLGDRRPGGAKTGAKSSPRRPPTSTARTRRFRFPRNGLGDRQPAGQALGLRDLEDVRGAAALRVPRALRHRRRPHALLRRVRPQPESDLVGRPAVRLHRERARRRAARRCMATDTRRVPSRTSPTMWTASRLRREHEPTTSSSTSVARGRDHHPGARRAHLAARAGRRRAGAIETVPYAVFGKYEDVIRRVPDITRARDLLGFEPKVDLETGLRTTIRVAGRASPKLPTA